MSVYYPELLEFDKHCFECIHAQTVKLYYFDLDGERYASPCRGPLLRTSIYTKREITESDIVTITCKLPPIKQGLNNIRLLYKVGDICYLSKKFAYSVANGKPVKVVTFVPKYAVNYDVSKKFAVSVIECKAFGLYNPNLYGKFSKEYLVPVIGAKEDGTYIVHYDRQGNLVACDENFVHQNLTEALNIFLDNQEVLFPAPLERYYRYSIIDSQVRRIHLAGGSGSIVALFPDFGETIKFVSNGILESLYRSSYETDCIKDTEVLMYSFFEYAYEELIGVEIPDVKIPGLFIKDPIIDTTTGHELFDSAIRCGVLQPYSFRDQFVMYKPNKLNPAYMNYSASELKGIFDEMKIANEIALAKAKSILKR